MVGCMYGIRTKMHGRTGCDVIQQEEYMLRANMGLQVLDQAGRVNAIIPIPAGQPSNLCFAGKNFDILYLTAGDKVYRRKLRTRGANNFEKPYKPVPETLIILIFFSHSCAVSFPSRSF